MATASEEERTAIKQALDFLALKDNHVLLKPGQNLAIRNMLEGEDVLAVLPTGFGKSLIFTVYGIAEKIRTKAPISVLVICPLKSIMYLRSSVVRFWSGIMTRHKSPDHHRRGFFRTSGQAHTGTGPDLFSGFTALDPPRSATLGAARRATADGLQHVRG